MSRSHLVKTTRLGFRAVRCSNARRAPFRPPLSASSAVRRSTWSSSSYRFSTCAVRPQSTQPDNASAATPASEAKPVIPTPAELSVNTYHELADAWLDHALARFEELQDQSDDIDVEYSSGVMTLKVAEKGTYVLNKQPPNKQIWLSSPLSGPKRYDWCVVSGGRDGKSDTGEAGQWVYARDGSTLDQLILEELNVDLQEPVDD
ncbi:Frataxin-like protein [Hapsidospora chrysogenum ATCC 11550]|uniref:ferroxidase n=1 Tax=Hapsidospora chrysogenum (strain ATCC 11550 / CBS 779.69 / DSM 880 / IAM 14645 / JCM 23072 / IMI 49137) TaxID=857340 RepID=A0A086SWI5_HAPC1|nr:Frataxin-like protein [Hapsidospora chrysogenum ATCC 11550]